MAEHIRFMGENDLPEVCKLYLDANKFSNIDSIHKWTLINLKLFPELQLVYSKSNHILGAISGNISSGKGHIDDIAVSENYRSSGVGKKLLLKELDIFKQLYLDSVELWVHSKNEKAIPFYERNGFNMSKIEYTNNLKDVPDGEKITHMAYIY